MNDRNRRPTNRRPDSNEPRFCSRCGGTFAASNQSNQNNVCRCKREQKPTS